MKKNGIGLNLQIQANAATERFLDSGRYRGVVRLTSPGQFSSPLKPFYGCDGRHAVAHTFLMEQAGVSVCGVIFQ
jgi:hypothetical protein